MTSILSLTPPTDAVQTIIDEHRKDFHPDCIRDYIDSFLYEQKYGKESKYFTVSLTAFIVKVAKVF